LREGLAHWRATAAPRSLAAKHSCGAAADDVPRRSAAALRPPRPWGRRVPMSTRSTLPPASTICIGQEGEFLSFRVGCADDVDTRFIGSPRRRNSSASRLPSIRILLVCGSRCFFLRRAYRIDMDVSRQSDADGESGRTGTARADPPVACSRRQFDLMQSGLTPSVSEVAEAAERIARDRLPLFPKSGRAMVQAVVDARASVRSCPGDPRPTDAERRVANLIETVDAAHREPSRRPSRRR
jgi:hypothetical protein